MNKFFAALAIASFIFLACSLPAVSVSQPKSDTPVPTAQPTETAVPATVTPEIVASPTLELAPLCEADLATLPPPSECHVPLAEEVSTYCQSKNPYNTLLLNPGSNYKVLTDGFTCTDGGMKDDRKVVVCSGPMAASFEITVCNASCMVPTVEAKTTQCPQDYKYDDLHGCCTKQALQENESCKTLKFKTTSCVVNCSAFTTDGKCRQNSYACQWDDKENVCVQRK
jgi:hypothetical protein